MGIAFDDEIRALVLLSSLPESWNGLVVAVSNSSGSGKIKLEDVVASIIGEESRRKTTGKDVVSGSALNTEERGRSTKKGDNKRGKGRSYSKNRGRSKFRGGDEATRHVVRRGTSRGTARHRKINRMRIIKEVKTLLILLTSLIMMP